MYYMKFNESKKEIRSCTCDGCEKAMANGERSYKTCGNCSNWFFADVHFISYLLKSCTIVDHGPIDMEVSLIKENYTQALGILQELIEYLTFLETKDVTTIKKFDKFAIACAKEVESLEKAAKEEDEALKKVEEEINIVKARILKRRRKAYEKNKNFFEKKIEKLAAKERKEYTLKLKTVARIKKEKRRADRRAANKFAIKEFV